MMMKLEESNLVWLRSVGRVLLGVLFLYSGVMLALGGMDTISGLGMAITATGFPMGSLVVWIVLAIKILGGGALILGWHSRIAASAIILFVTMTILFAHNTADELGQALKNLSIIGGLLYVVATGPGPYTIVSLMKGNAASEAVKQNDAARASL